MNHEVEKEVGELAYLRHFRRLAIDMLENRHCDEPEEHIQEVYVEAGHTVPKEYAKS